MAKKTKAGRGTAQHDRLDQSKNKLELAFGKWKLSGTGGLTVVVVALVVLFAIWSAFKHLKNEPVSPTSQLIGPISATGENSVAIGVNNAPISTERK